MATGKITLDEGSTTNTATYTGTEDAVTKHAGRVVLNNSSLTEVGTASTPLQVSLANTAANSTAVKVDGSAVTQPVSGTVTANAGSGTMAVSAASLPLPSGAATSANQSTANTSLSSIDGKLVTAKTSDYDTGAGTDTVQMTGIALPASGGAVAGGTSTNPIRTDPTGTTTQPVSGTVTANAGSGTFAVSAASLPLPSGAATAAKQPALGTAGTASSDVLSVQGIASMTPLSSNLFVGGSVVSTSNAVPIQPPASGALAVSVAAGAATIAKAEDAASADGDVGVPAMAIRKATPANTSGTDGDYEALQMSAGRLWVDASGKTLTVDGSAVNQPVVGAAAHDAAVSGNPNVVASEARTSRGTAVQNGDVVRNTADVYGRQFVIKPGITTTSSAGTAITTNTNTSIVAAPSAGNHLKIYRLFAQNSSATGTWIYWTEGSGGTKKVPMYLAQYQACTINLEGTWELATATALFINSATTGANIEWMVQYETVVD